MRAHIVLLFVGLALGDAGAEQLPPLEVKGVPLGSTMAELQAKIPGFDCNPHGCSLVVSSYAGSKCRDPFDSKCRFAVWDEMKFGPAMVDSYWADFMGGRLGRMSIHFAQASIGALVIALTEKYGQPTSDTMAPIQNRAGAKFDNRIVTWSRSDGRIRVEQRAASIDQGAAVISSKEYDDASAKESVDKAKVSAKGL